MSRTSRAKNGTKNGGTKNGLTKKKKASNSSSEDKQYPQVQRVFVVLRQLGQSGATSQELSISLKLKLRSTWRFIRAMQRAGVPISATRDPGEPTRYVLNKQQFIDKFFKGSWLIWVGGLAALLWRF